MSYTPVQERKGLLRGERQQQYGSISQKRTLWSFSKMCFLARGQKAQPNLLCTVITSFQIMNHVSYLVTFKESYWHNPLAHRHFFINCPSQVWKVLTLLSKILEKLGVRLGICTLYQLKALQRAVIIYFTEVRKKIAHLEDRRYFPCVLTSVLLSVFNSWSPRKVHLWRLSPLFDSPSAL